MVDTIRFVLILVAALGCGLNAGVFFAFSSFVMRALTRLPPTAGLAAMQSMNRAAVTSVFLGLFLGTAAACSAVVITALVRWDAPGASFLLAGSMLYLVGSLLVTVMVNVPMNDMLASVAPTDPHGIRDWATYGARWTAWNHLRAAAALGASTLLTVGLSH